MNEQSRQRVRKTYKYELKPTPEQEWELGRVLMLCRWLYNTALEQRIIAWQRMRASVSRFAQEAELKDIHAAFPEYGAFYSHVLQDVLARLDKTYQAFFRRMKAGERRASRAIKDVIAGIPSRTKSLAMALPSTTAFSFFPRSGASPFVGLGLSKGRPRPSR
jgi:hypothetical protein